MKHKAFLGFCLLEILACLVVFRGALWGQSLLAPVDVAPALLANYRYVDPDTTKIPANHYIVDQLFYDLPLQKTIHAAVQRWEMPWWDPYTFGGRPLLADAHVNGTDPVRLLLYRLLPFEAAYNWTLIAHALLTGLGMFLLLGRLNFGAGTRTWLAVAYQFAGCYTLFIGHPWIQGAFLYYPFLWLAWDAGLRGRARWSLPAGALLAAAIFYAGNLQSHAYLPLFAAALAAGYAGRDAGLWKRAAFLVGGSLLIGGLLALPVLSGQLELFAIGTRPISPHFGKTGWLAGPAALGALFPWLLGTFRTLDASKLFGQTALGFSFWTGCAGMALALGGFFRKRDEPDRLPVLRTARLLAAGTLLLLSTPLVGWLYLRMAPLAVMGLIVLAAAEVEYLADFPRRRLRWGIGLLAAVALVALGLALLPAVYPRWMPAVEQVVGSRQESASLAGVPELRAFQVRNLPAELSLRSQEVFISLLSLALLGGLLVTSGGATYQRLLAVLLRLNLIPLLLFAGRFIPHAPLDQWRRLEAGSREQNKIMDLLSGQPARLTEPATASAGQLFPFALAHLYRVHTAQGYAALKPDNPALHASAPGDGAGRRPARGVPVLDRFQWEDGEMRSLFVGEPSLNAIDLTIDPGPAARLLRTDTSYPGWRAEADGKAIPVEKAAPFYSRIKIPAGVERVTLRYRPRFLTAGLAGAAVGLALLLWAGARKQT